MLTNTFKAVDRGSSFIFYRSGVIYPSITCSDEDQKNENCSSTCPSSLLIWLFMMKNNRSIEVVILPGMWTASLYLTDEHLHVPICASFRIFLCLIDTTDLTNSVLSCSAYLFNNVIQKSKARLNLLFLPGRFPLPSNFQTTYLSTWMKSLRLVFQHLGKCQDFLKVSLLHYHTHQRLVFSPREKFQKL